MGRSLSTIAVALLLAVSLAAGTGGITTAAASTSAPSGMVGVPTSNLDDLRHSQAPRNVSAADLEGAVYVSAHASTTEVALVTTEQANRVAEGANPADVAGERVCSNPSASKNPVMGCDQRMALVVSDDTHHSGREVAIKVSVVKAALGHVPETLAVANNETGETMRAATRVQDGWLIAEIPHFSSNSVTWDGEVNITGTYTNQSQVSYELKDLDGASDISTEATGTVALEWDNETKQDQTLGTSQTVNVGGDLDPHGPSVNGLPELTASLPITQVGSATDGAVLGGNVKVARDGNYVYAASPGTNTFSVIDVSTPSSPSVVGSVSSANLSVVKDVVVNGTEGTVFVSTDFNDRVISIDVSTPSSPVILEEKIIGTNPEGMALDGTYLYVVDDGQDRMRTVDVSNPSNMSVANSLTDAAITGPLGTTQDGNYVYITNKGNNGVAVVDVTDPLTPSVVGSVTDSVALETPRGIVSSGSYAYVTGDNGQVTSVDVSTPSSPTVAGSWNDSNVITKATRLAVSGSYVYVAGHVEDRYVIVNVSDPTLPTLVDYKDQTKNTIGIAADGTNAYLGGGDTLRVVTKHESASSVSASSDGANAASASFGSLETGDSVTKELGLASDATALSWSGSGDAVDVALDMKERQGTPDGSVEINDNSTSWAALADGETVTGTIPQSSLFEGTNYMNVTLNTSGISADAPTPQVQLVVNHTASSDYSAQVDAEKWSERYNVTRTWASDRQNATLEIPFMGTVVSTRDLSLYSNGTEYSPAWTAWDGTTLTIGLGDVSANEETNVRVTGSKVVVSNGAITVLEPTSANYILDSKIRLDSKSDGFRIDVSNTSGGKTHYTVSETWASPNEYARHYANGTQELYLPGSSTGSEFRVRTIPLYVTPGAGGVDARVRDASVPEFRLEAATPDADSVTVTYSGTVDGDPLADNADYAMVDLNGDEYSSGTASDGSVTFKIGADARTYQITQQSGGTTVVSVTDTGGGADPLSIVALLGGMAAAMIGFVFAGRRWFGATSLRSNGLLLVGGGVVGLVGVEAVTPRSVIGEISRSLGFAIGGAFGGALGAVVMGILLAIGLFLVHTRLFSLPVWILVPGGAAIGLYMVEEITGGALSGGLAEISPLVWFAVIAGGLLLAWRALSPTVIQLSGGKK